MKFLPENKRKQAIYAVVLLISFGGIVYFNFFTGAPSLTKPADTVYPAAMTDAASQAPATTGTAGKAVPVVRQRGSGPFPYGFKIDTSVFDSAIFKALRAAAPFDIPTGELGKTDLFSK
ncbi:hypothetical protein D4R52_01510 [bacterium]|nr:MAG: hypothetical protein D4R52_01510 [bacterium]